MNLFSEFTTYVVSFVIKPPQPFLGCYLGFCIFFHTGSLGDVSYFHSLGVLLLISLPFVFAYFNKAGHRLALEVPFYLLFFFLLQKLETVQIYNLCSVSIFELFCSYNYRSLVM